MRRRHILDSFRHALDGIVHVFQTQRHMRYHVLTVLMVLTIGLLYRLDSRDMLLLLFTVSLVLITEMFNTAVEVMIDLFNPAFHPLAKIAKDIAAGAVLISSINAVVVGFFLFVYNGRLQRFLQQDLKRSYPDYMLVIATGAILLMMLVLAGQGWKGPRFWLRGGLISVRSALGFFLAMTILFVSSKILVGTLAFALALLIAYERVESKRQTVQEVVLGGLLAIFLSALLYWTLP
ncbi:MAG: diacylglycerol kinase [Armatimonadetes bacterium]|nr:diacylglycerol kinase [Armatimonadota bacterium]